MPEQQKVSVIDATKIAALLSKEAKANSTPTKIIIRWPTVNDKQALYEAMLSHANTVMLDGHKNPTHKRLFVIHYEDSNTCFVKPYSHDGFVNPPCGWFSRDWLHAQVTADTKGGEQSSE